MSKKSKKQNKNRDYGLVNVHNMKLTKTNLQTILKKQWNDITGLDLYKLYLKGWKTESIMKNYKKPLVAVLNRLRLK